MSKGKMGCLGETLNYILGNSNVYLGMKLLLKTKNNLT